VLLFPKELGIHHMTREEVEDYSYVMYLVGKHLGITDQFNLCREATSCFIPNNPHHPLLSSQ
jgi:hypothetical protein